MSDLRKNKKASRETNAQTTKPTTRPLPRSEGKQRERGKQESAPEARRDKAKQNDTQSNPAGAKNLKRRHWKLSQIGGVMQGG